MINNVIVPEFKENHFYLGIHAGLRALIKRIEDSPNSAIAMWTVPSRDTAVMGSAFVLRGNGS